MAAHIHALDNYTPSQSGEKGHLELGWSNNMKKKIVQFSFQLTRTENTSHLEKNLKEILFELKNKPNLVSKEYLKILYKMIGHTRDIIDGKGECALTYMMICVWYDFFPELSLFALSCLVIPLPLEKVEPNRSSLPLEKVEPNRLPEFTVDLALPFSKVEKVENVDQQYGSWKDIKYFCELCHSKGYANTHPLIKYSVNLLNTQLKEDYTIFTLNPTTDISLVSKWIPREKSKFGWLYTLLSTHYFPTYIESAKTFDQKKKAILKCNMEYRKILSTLNNKLDTTQIKQCNKTWSTINFNTVTSITISKQKKAFLNITKKSEPKHPELQDRVLCADHFNDHITKATKGKIEMKGKRVGLNDFTKQALELINQRLNGKVNNNEIELLNLQWENNATQTKTLRNMIAMVDVSGSMDGEPLHAAISLGIRIAEKSILGKRILTFSSNPTWCNLENKTNYVDMVEQVKTVEWGTSTNFYAALTMILNAIVISKMDADEVKDLVLAIFSDMQMDEADNTFFKGTLYETIQEKYADAGMKICGKPYPTPHILFWNLRSTNGFPVSSSQTNTTMMSGFSPALLNLFCETGIESLESMTPWTMLIQSLNNERYQILEDKIMEE